MQNLENAFFNVTLKNKPLIIQFFVCLNFTLVLITAFGAFAIATSQSYFPFFYELGTISGQIAVVFFILTLLPGMMRRFGVTSKIFAILMMFRRYLGILVYLFALMHAVLIKIVFNIMQYASTFPPVAVFEIFGIISLELLLVLVLTSNNFSVAKLGKWWKRIHSLVYIIVWLIFLHIALLQFNIWAVLIGITACLEVFSFVVRFQKNKLK